LSRFARNVTDSDFVAFGRQCRILEEISTNLCKEPANNPVSIVTTGGWVSSTVEIGIDAGGQQVLQK
jgi:hypothetical protein